MRQTTGAFAGGVSRRTGSGLMTKHVPAIRTKATAKGSAMMAKKSAAAME